MKKKLYRIVCLCSLVSIVLCACGKNTNSEVNVTHISDGLESEYTCSSPEIDKLREKYPEYFELGTFKGLEVYVWQMAEDDYRFGLMQGTNRQKTFEELMALKGASPEEMALILSAFDIDDRDIFVIPWQNPISSYMVTDDMVKDPEYISNLRNMLGLDLDEELMLKQEEADVMYDRIPMVRVDGKLYYDTGKESTINWRCGNMDGEITSTVDGTEIPTEDNQSNFGSGFNYQYGADDTIEIYMNEKWFVFEYREESE